MRFLDLLVTPEVAGKLHKLVERIHPTRIENPDPVVLVDHIIIDC